MENTTGSLSGGIRLAKIFPAVHIKTENGCGNGAPATTMVGDGLDYLL